MSALVQTPIARRPALDHALCGRLAEVEFQRFIDGLGRLQEEDWTKATECPSWDVRALASHVLGMAQMFSGYGHNARQHLPAARAARHGAVYIDALTARQVADREALTVPEIRVRLTATAPRSVRWRQRTPSMFRRRAMPGVQPVSAAPGAPVEPWTFGYLFDVILVRDTWMHRGDIARAVGASLELTPQHDGVLVADVVDEWASRHAEPYSLILTGPAGGSWTRGDGGTHLELDAVEFCRVVSGRGQPEGLLAVAVPF